MRVTGPLKVSPAKGQKWELPVESFELIGPSDGGAARSKAKAPPLGSAQARRLRLLRARLLALGDSPLLGRGGSGPWPPSHRPRALERAACQVAASASFHRRLMYRPPPHF